MLMDAAPINGDERRHRDWDTCQSEQPGCPLCLVQRIADVMSRDIVYSEAASRGVAPLIISDPFEKWGEESRA